MGSDPQTGQPKDEFGCTLRWLPILLTENATMIRRAGASSDKTATEVARLHGTLFASMPEEAQQRIMQANPKMLGESDAKPK